MSGQAHEKKPNSPVTMNRPAPGMLSSVITVARAHQFGRVIPVPQGLLTPKVK